MLLAIIFGFVVVVAAGILIAIFLGGDKPSDKDFEDDFDIAIGETQTPPEETLAPSEETHAPPPNNDPAAIIGLWSSQELDTPVASLPESYAQRAFNTDPKDKAALLALIEDLRKDTEYATFHVYREDGTGYFIGIRESGYGFSTFDYFDDGEVLYKTNIIGTNEDEDPDWSYTDKPFEDTDNEYRIFAADGQERLHLLPNFGEDSMYYGMTMDEYIETEYAEGLAMIKIM